MSQELSKYNYNVKFYRVLKIITQAKFTKDQFNKLKIHLNDNNINTKSEKWESEISQKLSEIFTSEDVIGKSKSRKVVIEPLVHFINNFSDKQFVFRCIYVAIFMYNEKATILDEMNCIELKAKNYNEKVSDLLSLQYDEQSIEMPYLLRSATPLVISQRFNNQEIEERVFTQVELLKSLYHIDVLGQYNLIIGESINQSITSNAGTSYENRFTKLLSNLEIDFETGVHDDRQSSVEYDVVFKAGNYKIGVSLKRTLRERYKQNHRAVHELAVDKMLVVTLGTDLNEKKMDNILALQGQYILVAAEVYDRTQYMIDCPRVYSSNNFSELLNVLSVKGY